MRFPFERVSQGVKSGDPISLTDMKAPVKLLGATGHPSPMKSAHSPAHYITQEMGH